jgi:hypothetical protein
VLGGNPFLRCALPPFNAGSDTLRQFNQNGKIPTRRVIPLPVSTTVGGNVTNVTNTSVTQAGSSSGGSTVATLTARSVSINVPSLAPGGTFTAIAQTAKSFQLLQLSATAAVEVRLYGDTVTQGSDIIRLTDTAVPFEVTPGVITDVVFDTAPYVWTWQNRAGVNADSPQTSNVYVTVVNPSTVAATVNSVVTIMYLPLES